MHGAVEEVEGAGGSPGASFGFYLREEFQSQTNTEKNYTTRVVRH